MNMMKRRMMMAMDSTPSGELYPIGTDIVGKYIGRDNNGYALFTAGYGLDRNGNYVSGISKASSPVYMPIDPSYTYQKSAKRMYDLTFYDSDKVFISQVASTYNSLTAQTIDNIPQNAAFIRFDSHQTAISNWEITITRTA